MAAPTPGLYNLLVEKKYDLVLNRTISHPHDICWRDDRNYTVFHRLCYLPGVDRNGEQTAQLVVHMLHAAEKVKFCCMNDDNFSMWNGARGLVLDQGGRSRWSPLHLVSMHCGFLDDRDRLIQAILIFDEFGNDPHNILGINNNHLNIQQRKENIDFMRVLVNQQDRQGRTAFHHFLRREFRASRIQSCISLLLSLDPSLIFSKDKEGRTPLVHCFHDVSGICLENHDRYKVAKFILQMLEKVSFDSSYYNDMLFMNKRGNFFHFILSLPNCVCPQILILSLISNNPHSKLFQELDDDSNLPIHVFVSNRTHFTFEESSKSNDDQTNHRSKVSTSPCRETKISIKNRMYYQEMIVSALIEAFPDSLEMSGSSGKRATDMAIVSGVTWKTGLTRLFYKDPFIYQRIDLDIKLYPFLLAKLSYINEDKPKNLSMIFNVLHGRPDILKEDSSYLRYQDESSQGNEPQKHQWKLKSLFLPFRQKISRLSQSGY